MNPSNNHNLINNSSNNNLNHNPQTNQQNITTNDKTFIEKPTQKQSQLFSLLLSSNNNDVDGISKTKSKNKNKNKSNYQQQQQQQPQNVNNIQQQSSNINERDVFPLTNRVNNKNKIINKNINNNNNPKSKSLVSSPSKRYSYYQQQSSQENSLQEKPFNKVIKFNKNVTKITAGIKSDQFPLQSQTQPQSPSQSQSPSPSTTKSSQSPLQYIKNSCKFIQENNCYDNQGNIRIDGDWGDLRMKLFRKKNQIQRYKQPKSIFDDEQFSWKLFEYASSGMKPSEGTTYKKCDGNKSTTGDDNQRDSDSKQRTGNQSDAEQVADSPKHQPMTSLPAIYRNNKKRQAAAGGSRQQLQLLSPLKLMPRDMSYNIGKNRLSNHRKNQRKDKQKLPALPSIGTIFGSLSSKLDLFSMNTKANKETQELSKQIKEIINKEKSFYISKQQQQVGKAPQVLPNVENTANSKEKEKENDKKQQNNQLPIAPSSTNYTPPSKGVDQRESPEGHLYYKVIPEYMAQKWFKVLDNSKIAAQADGKAATDLTNSSNLNKGGKYALKNKGKKKSKSRQQQLPPPIINIIKSYTVYQKPQLLSGAHQPNQSPQPQSQPKISLKKAQTHIFRSSQEKYAFNYLSVDKIQMDLKKKDKSNPITINIKKQHE